jgi:hypothetical protein
MRTYEFLQQQEIIHNQRVLVICIAIGYEECPEYRKNDFVEKDLPQVFRTMFIRYGTG